jgi:DNA-binding NtrC family response regulator
MSPTRASPSGLSILVVDPAPAVREILSRHLAQAGHRCRTAEDGDDALAALRAEAADLVVTDLHMPGRDGLALLCAMRAEGMTAEAVVVSNFLDVPKAVSAFRFGACDLIEKPFSLSRLDEAVEIARARLGIAREGSIPAPERGIIGRSAPIREIAAAIEKVGPSEATVLIDGETGVGKEVVARAIHAASPRRAKPFVAVNCGALPEPLVEAELFGHEKGAYTGAAEARRGYFRAASGGTIFLDEIGELSPAAQVKLLRALQEREIMPVGASRPERVDVRVVAATNRDIEAAVREGRFRKDLLYRLNVVRISIPPLRERPEDVEPLVEHFIARCNARYGRKVEGLEPEAREALLRYDYPGNARELENLVERAFALGAKERIRAKDLPPLRPHFRTVSRETAAGGAPALGAGEIPTLARAKDILIERALEAAGGNIERAAAILGISSKTISRHRKRRRSFEKP